MGSRPLVLFTVAFAVGILLAQRAKISLAFVFLFLGVALGVLLLGRVCKKNRPQVFLVLAFGGFLLAGFFWALSTTELKTSALTKDLHTFLYLTGVVAAEPQVYPNRVVYTLEGREVKQENWQKQIKEKIQLTVYPAPLSEKQKRASASHPSGTPASLVTKSSPPYRYGDVLKVHGQLELPQLPRNPGEFNYRAYLARRGIFTTLKVKEEGVQKIGEQKLNPFLNLAFRAKERVKGIIGASLPSREAHILQAILFGDKEGLAEAQLNVWKNLGVMHVFAVSGLHVGYVLVLALALGRCLRLSPSFLLVLTTLLLLFYGALCGFTPSVSRAIIMAVVGLGAYEFGREKDFATSLALAAFILLLINPTYLFEAGFQLSFAATAGIVYFYPLWDYLLSFLPPWRRYLAAPLAAQLATFPFVTYHFNTFPLLALPANLLVVPVVGVVVTLGLFAFGFSFLFPSGAEMLFLSAGALLEGLNLCLAQLASLPGASFSLATPGLWLSLFSSGVIIAFRELTLRKREWLLPFSLIFLLFLILSSFPKSAPLKVVFLDVGQGTAVYIRTPEGRNLLYDGGGTSPYLETDFEVGQKIVVPFLQRQGVRRLDVVLSSHPDQDHLQGLFTVLEEIPTSLLVCPAPLSSHPAYQALFRLAAEKKVPVAFASQGDTLQIGSSVAFNFLHPSSSFAQTQGSENNHSLVLRISWGEISFLLTGDIERETMENLLQTCPRQLPATVLGIPHHGSPHGDHKPFLEAVSPHVVVIQVGEGNNYGHPAPQIINFWAQKGVPLYRTDLHGAVTITTNGKTFLVSPFLSQFTLEFNC